MCESKILHTDKRSRDRAIAKGAKCRSCAAKKLNYTQLDDGTFYRRCNECDTIMVYATYNAWRSSKYRNCVCQECGYKRNARKFKKGKNVECEICGNQVWSKPSERRRYCSQQCSGIASKPRVRKQYLKRLAEQHGQLSPFYNSDACKLFDQINEELGWNGRHAENGGEYHIDGYWLDYYEPTLNVVIEYDEPHHYVNEKLSEKDVIRQTTIEEKLKCKFYRIKSSEEDKWKEILNLKLY